MSRKNPASEVHSASDERNLSAFSVASPPSAFFFELGAEAAGRFLELLRVWAETAAQSSVKFRRHAEEVVPTPRCLRRLCSASRLPSIEGVRIP
eukprot:2409526-Rhodomonas_salina.1